MKKVVILTGPAGAGKNTVSEKLAKLIPNSAIVNIDDVRFMLKNPHKAPWEGEEGQRQLEFGIKNGCMLARSFYQKGYSVILLDVISSEGLELYQKELEPIKPKVVLLLPSFGEVVKRNGSREYSLHEGRVKYLYEMEKNFKDYDLKIDNTDLSPEKTAQEVKEKIWKK